VLEIGTDAGLPPDVHFLHADHGGDIRCLHTVFEVSLRSVDGGNRPRMSMRRCHAGSSCGALMKRTM
jgi:hypothetical protein